MLDRSWYNRAGVEQVMGFCRARGVRRPSCDEAPDFERKLTGDGVTVIKLWFSVTRAEQLRRFVSRHDDSVKRWKLSPIDLASLDRWDEYTRAKEAMFRHTDVAEAPWTVIKSNDKKRARLEAMRYVLSLFDYDGKDAKAVGQLDPLIAGAPGTLPELGAGAALPHGPQVPARAAAAGRSAEQDPGSRAETRRERRRGPLRDRPKGRLEGPIRHRLGRGRAACPPRTGRSRRRPRH